MLFTGLTVEIIVKLRLLTSTGDQLFRSKMADYRKTCIPTRQGRQIAVEILINC